MHISSAAAINSFFTAAGCHICRPVNRDRSGGFPQLQVPLVAAGVRACVRACGGGPDRSVSGHLRLSYRGGAEKELSAFT